MHTFGNPFGILLDALFVQKYFCSSKRVFLERVFCGVLFALSFYVIFNSFLAPWNHENSNSSGEGHGNQEIVNLQRANEFITSDEGLNSKLDLSFLLRLHAIVTEGDKNANPGNLRTKQVVFGGKHITC